MEGRAQMETYQLVRAGMMEATTSPVANVDWSVCRVLRHQLMKCGEKFVTQGQNSSTCPPAGVHVPAFMATFGEE